MSRVAIAGIGQTEFSKSIGRSERQIALEAIALALKDAGLSPAGVDGLVRFDMETTSEVEIARNLGIPNLRYFSEVGYGGGGGCAAVGHAAMAIEAGWARTVVCWRARNRGSGGRPWAGTRPGGRFSLASALALIFSRTACTGLLCVETSPKAREGLFPS